MDVESNGVLWNFTEERFWDKVAVGDECWEWQTYRDEKGYGYFSAHKNGRRARIPAHRAVYLMLVGPVPNNLCVLHTCDNPACCRPKHLFLGTNLDNHRDMWRKGRGVVPTPAHGESRPNAKLTEADVLAMRRSHEAGGVSMRQLARQYGVGPSTVQHIIHRTRWKHSQ
jgi:hypothetical protein